MKENPGQASFTPGANLRVDKALNVLPKGRRILDIGCGSGAFLTQAQKRFREVYGVDISETAISLARENDIVADIVDLNSQDLPYPDEYFDCLTLLSTVQYFYDPDATLRECHRVLSPSGTILLSVPNIRAFWRLARLVILGYFPRVSLDEEGYDGGTLHYFAYANLKELLSRNGFNVLWAHGIFCVPTVLNRLPDQSIIGTIKREFFSAEIFIAAMKPLTEEL